ncbi:MAG: SGNH/GDSL hydrolase family protein, partial [Verrucomicrobiota bacterium]
MSARFPIVIFGDSQIRTFSYSSRMLPFVIGPAAFNNYLSDALAESTRNKCLEIMSRIGRECHYIFYFSGDPHHHYKQTYKMGDDVLEKASERYVEVVREARDHADGKVMILSTAPGEEARSQTGEEYNTMLKEQCGKKDVIYLDIWSDIMHKGAVRPEYLVDGAHLDPCITGILIRKLKEHEAVDP